MAQIYKRNNKWSVRVVFKDSKGNRKTKNKGGFKTKKEAEVFATSLEDEKYKGTDLGKKNYTFSDYYDRWIQTFKLPVVVKSSQNRFLNYGKVIRKHFNDTKLVDISKYDYQDFMDKYSKGRAIETCRKINQVLRACVADAIDEQIIYSDFTRHVEFTNVKETKVITKFLSVKEYTSLIEAAYQNLSFDKLSYYIIYVGALTGLRYSEITGLTWDCIDFDNSKLIVKNTYDYHDTMKIVPRTKTKNSVRDYDMFPELKDTLKKLKLAQLKEYLKQGYIDSENALFKNKYHTIPSNVACNKSLNHIQEKIGIDENNRINMHGLRHTFASYLISQHLDTQFVSNALGHADTTITQRVYEHLLEETDKTETKKMFKALGKLVN